MAVTFEIRTSSTRSVQDLFDRARSMDLHVTSMSSARETVLDPVDHDLLGLGDDVTWRARHFGVWWTMTSRITNMTEPEAFTDEQVEGPFASFRHTHTFSQHGDRVVMTDRVELTAPFGPLGMVAERVVLGRYLRRMLEQRAEVVARDA